MGGGVGGGVRDPLNLILIKSKQFIYRMKMKKSLPIFETFKMQLHHIFKTEEYIAKKKLDLETYRVKWEKKTTKHLYPERPKLRVC